jgi:hypothetical protein
MRVAALIAAAAVATVAAVGIFGTRSEPRLAATNGVDAGSYSIVLPDSREHCERDQFVPGGADRLRMTIASFDRPMPRIDLRITDARGREVVDRVVPAPPAQGPVILPLGRTTDGPQRGATVCVGPRGRRIALAGFQDHPRMEWLRPGSESDLGMAGTILHRFGAGKPGWMGGWTLALALLLVAGVWAGTIRIVLRETAS